MNFVAESTRDLQAYATTLASMSELDTVVIEATSKFLSTNTRTPWLSRYGNRVLMKWLQTLSIREPNWAKLFVLAQICQTLHDINADISDTRRTRAREALAARLLR